MAFVERVIEVQCSFRGETGALQNLSFKGYRVHADIKIAGHEANTATIKIFGLSLSHMNALSVVTFKPTSLGQNTVKVLAGDEVNGMSVVFEGTVYQAWPDMQKAPEVFLRIDAYKGGFESVKPVEPTSFAGQTKVSTIANTIAGKFGLKLEDNGIQGVLNNPYYWGTAFQQMKLFGQATRIGWIPENDTLAVWPQNGVRKEAGSLTISPRTGMVGYPFAAPGGVMVKTLFKRTIKYASTIVVESDITIANGKWGVQSIDLQLMSQTPFGLWFATIFATNIGE